MGKNNAAGATAIKVCLNLSLATQQREYDRLLTDGMACSHRNEYSDDARQLHTGPTPPVLFS
jgi:hypothetical protein